MTRTTAMPTTDLPLQLALASAKGPCPVCSPHLGGCPIGMLPNPKPSKYIYRPCQNCGGNDKIGDGAIAGTGKVYWLGDQVRIECDDVECKKTKGYVQWTGAPHNPPGDTRYVKHPECQGRGWVPGDWAAFHSAALALPSVAFIEYNKEHTSIFGSDPRVFLGSSPATGFSGLLRALEQVAP